MNLQGFEARLNRFAVVDYDGWRSVELSGGIPSRTSFASVQEGSTDMDVRGVGSVAGATPVRPVVANPAARGVSATPLQSPNDQLEISSVGKMLDQISQNPDIRQERLARIKEAIANGTYDTDEKLEAALSRLLSTLGPEFDAD